MFWLTRLAVLFFCFLTFSSFAQQAKIDSAVCFIHDGQNRVLVVKELISDRLALPGGYVDTDETAVDAASRETFEETGIEVDDLVELTQLNNTIIFACRAKSAISIYELNSTLALVPFWKAPSFGKEIQAVYFMKPSSNMLSSSRFPEQVSLYLDFLNQSKPSMVNQRADFSDLSGNLDKYFFDPYASLHMRALIQRLPFFIEKMLDSVLKLSSWFGNVGIFFVLLPLCIAVGGIKRATQLAFGLVIVVSIVILVKTLFAIPRPMHLFPDLMVNKEWLGYSFPSEHSAIAFFTWGLVYIWYHSLGKSAVYLCLFPGLLASLSRVYLGANYLIDILVGSVLGIIVALLTTVIYKKEWLFKPMIWAGLGAINVFLAATMAQPAFLGCAVFCITYSIVLSYGWQAEVNLPYGFNFLAFALSSLGMTSIYFVFDTMSVVSNLKSHILLGQSISIILLTIWFFIITPRVSS